MTPEEEAVIEAAIAFREGSARTGIPPSPGDLLRTVDALHVARRVHDHAPGAHRETCLADEQTTWAVAEWRWVLAGDRVRLKGQEAAVTTSDVGSWHAAIESKRLSSGKWWDKVTPWEHMEVAVRLEHMGDRMLRFPASGKVEILCDEDRAKLLLFQRIGLERLTPEMQAIRDWNAGGKR